MELWQPRDWLCSGDRERYCHTKKNQESETIGIGSETKPCRGKDRGERQGEGQQQRQWEKQQERRREKSSWEMIFAEDDGEREIPENTTGHYIESAYKSDVNEKSEPERSQNEPMIVTRSFYGTGTKKKMSGGWPVSITQS